MSSYVKAIKVLLAAYLCIGLVLTLKAKDALDWYNLVTFGGSVGGLQYSKESCDMKVRPPARRPRWW